MLKKVLLFCFVLCLQSLAFGQSYVNVVDSSQYPVSASVGDIIPLYKNQAILYFRTEPLNKNIVDVGIIPSITYHVGPDGPISNTSIGWQYKEGTSQVDGYGVMYMVCDASTVYTRSGSIPSATLNIFQSFLESKKLGTVQQRAALIRGFHPGPVQILDIDNFKKSILNALSPFLNIYLGIFLTLFVVDLMSKKSKDVIAESAKIQRRAERAQQRREIRADPTAQIFEFRLANFSSIASGSVSDPSISRRKARRLFEDTAMEYAEYKKSRGWKY